MKNITGKHLITFKTNPPRKLPVGAESVLAEWPKRTGLVFDSYDEANTFINGNFNKLPEVAGPIPLVRINAGS